LSKIIAFVHPRLAMLSYVVISSALAMLFPLLDVLKQREHVWEYCLLICAFPVLFALPLIVVAEYLRPKFQFHESRDDTKSSSAKAAVFGITLLIFVGVFLYVTSQAGLFFRRIGFSALVERSLDMPIYDLAIHRSFMETTTTLLCVAIALIAAARLRGAVRVMLVVVAALTFAAYFSFTLLNNRFQSIILLLEITIALVYMVGYATKERQRVLIGALVLISLVAAYSFRATSNIRDQIYIFGCIDTNVLNPFQGYIQLFERAKRLNGSCDGIHVHLAQYVLGDFVKPDAVKNESKTSGLSASTKAVLDKELDRPWTQRLDAFKLSAEITKPAFEQGYGWGRFWFKPIALYVYYFTNRDEYYAIKRNLQTNPKVMISDTYLHKQIDDTPSMILSDLYANFSLLGFLIGGLFMGAVLAFVDASLMRSLTMGPIVIGFFLLEKSLYGEKEFITLLIDLVKFVPVPLIAAGLLWNVPLRRQIDA
jgi:hypothetical protein